MSQPETKSRAELIPEPSVPDTLGRGATSVPNASPWTAVWDPKYKLLEKEQIWSW